MTGMSDPATLPDSTIGGHALLCLPRSTPVKPSEYFQRNIGIGASCVLRPDLDMRNEIGLEKVMWGSDFPHPEGSWPNTAQYLKDNFSNFPEQDGRKILGENAINFYGLDRQRLQAVADEIGPSATLFN